VSRLSRRSAVLLIVTAAVVSVAWGVFGDTPPAYGTTGGVFTPAHSTFGSAVRDFFGIRPTAVQPIEFPHKTHVEQKIACTEYCHEPSTKGPVAGLPGVKTCMICHDAIATDKPRIQQITKLSEEGRDLAWQRVYGYAPQAHVRFNHAPHIRAKVDCATCHGNIAEQTVAQRNVDLTMGFCVNCHKQKNAPNDCLTCHY
jgi:cytochrome c7-like protein